MIQLRNGHRVFAASYGDEKNETIMLIHDVGRKHHVWDDQIQFLMRSGYHVIVTDLLGHGRSERVKSLTVEDWHQQIIDVMDFYMVNEVVLVTMFSSYFVMQGLLSTNKKRLKKVISILPDNRRVLWFRRWKSFIKEKVKSGSDALEVLQERLVLKVLSETITNSEFLENEDLVYVLLDQSGRLSVGAKGARLKLDVDRHQWLRINSGKINDSILKGMEKQ